MKMELLSRFTATVGLPLSSSETIHADGSRAPEIEVTRVIDLLKSHKTAGLDGLSPAFVKSGDEVLASDLKKSSRDKSPQGENR